MDMQMNKGHIDKASKNVTENKIASASFIPGRMCFINYSMGR